MDSKADTEEGAIQGSIQVLKYDKGDLERYRVRKRRREREREREKKRERHHIPDICGIGGTIYFRDSVTLKIMFSRKI